MNLERDAVFNHLSRIFSHPSQSIGYIRHVGTALNGKINSRSKSDKSVAVSEKDWDTLIILDGCRYDSFQQEIHLNGELQQRTSLASTSQTYLDRNFGSGQHGDIVYLSANPFSSELSSDTFHAHIPVYENWNEELGTVLPETMNKAMRNAHRIYPNKRIIGHYMQPHYPFIGRKGKNIDHRGYSKNQNWSELSERSIWYQLQFGLTNSSRKDIVEAYEENLRLVLESISQLIDDISGKVAITADHGNLIGNIQSPIPVRGFGHPMGINIPELRCVPWFIPPYSERRKTTAECCQTQKSDRMMDEEISRRLQSLGYK